MAGGTPQVGNEQYRSAFTKAKFGVADTPVVAGVITKIGSYKVQAGEAISLGYGTNESQEGSPGRFYIDLRDNSAAPGTKIDGIIRFSVWSPQNRPIKILYEVHTAQVRTDAVNRTLQLPFPSSNFPFVTQDKQIVIEFIPDTNSAGSGTLSATNSTIMLDMTLGVAV